MPPKCHIHGCYYTLNPDTGRFDCPQCREFAELSKPMSFDELRALLNHVYVEHSPANIGLRDRVIVKYIDPHVDMRTGECFAVGFRCFNAPDTVIHTQNECRMLPDSLFTRCMNFLDKKG